MSKPMTFSKKSIFYLVLAAISFGLMVVFIFDWSKNFFGYNLDNIITGVILLAGGYYLLIPVFLKKKDQFKWLIFSELFILTVVSTVTLILPEFIENLDPIKGSASLWLGLLLMLHAVVHLFIDRFNEEKMKPWMFAGLLILLAFGAFILDSKTINVDMIIKVCVVALFLILALTLLYIALRLPRVEGKEQPTKEIEGKNEE